MVSAMDKGGEMLSLLIAQCHYVFLYRDLFSGHQSAPSAATEPSNQTNTAESMTGATRSLAAASSNRRLKNKAMPIPVSGAPKRSRGLRRNEASKCSIARSGLPANSLSTALQYQPRAK